MILNFSDLKPCEIGGRVYSPFDFDIIDDTTGENINHMGITYADDEKGFFRYHKTSPGDDGRQYLVADETGNLVVCEVHRKIRILPKLGTGIPVSRPKSDHAVS